MVVTGRFVVVAAVAALLVLARPEWSRCHAVGPGDGQLLWGVDSMRAPRPRQLQVKRDGATSVRASESVELQLRLTNDSHKTFRGMVRDAWPPSVDMTPSRHLTTIEPQGRRTLSSRCPFIAEGRPQSRPRHRPQPGTMAAGWVAAESTVAVAH